VRIPGATRVGPVITLAHPALKAGLEANAWKSGARFQVFESVVLSIGGEK